MLKLIRRCPEYADGYRDYCREMYDHHVVFFQPTNPDYIDEDWFSRTKDWYDRKEKGLVEGSPVSFHYWAVDNGRFIGEFQLRTEFPEIVMRDIGSIGYAVRVSEWRKGYGTEIIRQGLEKAKEHGMERVLFTVNDLNKASIHICEKFGGRLQDIIDAYNDAEGSHLLRRYWISLNKSGMAKDLLTNQGTGKNTDKHLLYRGALQGVFGKREQYSRSSITDALFVYLDGEPEEESIARIYFHFTNRPLVCLTKGWEEQIRRNYPNAAIYRRTLMKPSCRFTIPKNTDIPEGYLLAGMDEAAFEQHPFSHGINYPGWAAFREEGSGAVIYHNGEIVAAASSFLSVGGEIELDVSTKEAHRDKNLATACIARMLADCMDRGIIVHWDAQNDVSRHLAEKFGFEAETEYSVYWLLQTRKASGLASR